MKISINWLRELVSLGTAAVEEIARRLTSAGFEVEGRVQVGGGFAGVVMAEVRGARPHPKAEQLHLVDVFDGHEVVQVVCGAPVLPPAGALVPWARPGSRLPGGREIASREIRGVRSPGMLCAEDELGLGSSHEGLLVLDEGTPGADVATLLGEDTVLELNVTPNRPDCLGHRGVAREVAALFPEARWQSPELGLEMWTGDQAAETLGRVRIEDPVGCPRYTARIVRGIRVGQSGLKARLRLQSLGVRSISDVVDATNLAMLEWGHPLHAFDLDQLAGEQIIVRRARPGEIMVTLDGIERRLDPGDLLICDAERPVALAGVMGGKDTEVTAKTTRILLECAYFDPQSVRRTARRLGLHTEASHRFERGADPNGGLESTSARCTQLIARTAGGQIARGWIDAYPKRIERRTLVLRPARVTRVLGMEIPIEEEQRLLAALELEPQVREDGIHCSIPTFRPDLAREVDLIEEVARLYGYDRVPATLPRMVEAPLRQAVDVGELARDALRGLGLHEAVSFGFGAPERMAALWKDGDRRQRPLRIANPLGEELSVLRTSLLPGLLGAVAQNHARGVHEVRLFEVGTVFLAAEGELLPEEPQHAAVMLTGHRDGWLKPGGALDFFDIKGMVEALLIDLRVGMETARYRPPVEGEAPWLHPGVGAVLVIGDEIVGALGEVHPDVRQRFDIETQVFAFELSLRTLGQGAGPLFRDLPRFPGSSRDISFFVDEAVPAADMKEIIAKSSTLIESVKVLEDYREAGKVPAGKKGMLWSVGYRAQDHTVTDAEVGKEHERVLAALTERFGILPR
ncbi:MAG TPA: phenylalanine--tRNA ligase subunit beta [Polyangia bacterium]|jgi:phenylalanyl-tRNA synthetase beta chain|nr:phenylalanine--tRNA ligase subunit beta [Polyangia bacterium]